MKTYLCKSDFPYLMTHILVAAYGEAEVVTMLPTIIYKITTDTPIENIRNCKYLSDVREEDQAELV
jgi:hypothetical protein